MSQETTKRIYSAKDAVMLTVLSVILNNALENITELSEENENWNADSIEALQAKVEKDFKEILGIDPKKDQREATTIVKGIQAEALPILSTVSLRLNVAVKDAARRKELLIQLGFAAFGKKAQAKDQIALIELLAKMRTNTTAAVKAEITASKDIKAPVIDKLIGFADTLHQNNVTQETFKKSSEIVTANGVAELNATYTAVVTNFSKLVQDFYKKKKSPKANLFSFSSIKKTVQNNGEQNPPPPPSTPK